MCEYLLFSLYAPLAAMGEISVGERRNSWDRPAKSAVMGLAAAALGISRNNETGHGYLNDGYGYAVRIDAAGTPLFDYHTTQTPHARKGVRYETRKAELSALRLNSIPSRRGYRVDSAYTVALWTRNEPRWPLGDLAAALERPHFTLYFGRKSCPLALPLDPVVIEAADLLEALALRPMPAMLKGTLATNGASRLAADADADISLPGMKLSRRDRLTNRGRWQFADREEWVGPIPSPEQP